jgi:hypothetical protein
MMMETIMSAELDINVDQLDTSGLDPIMAKIIAEAAEKGRKKIEELQAKQAADRKSRVIGWKERQTKRKAEERDVRIKSGAEICQTFIQEVAGPYLRFCGRDDLEKFKDLRIVFIPGKSDQASGSSVAILDGTKRISTSYKASLQQMDEREERLLGRLQEKTGFTAGTPIEMMEEIARLQSQLSAQQHGKDGRMAVCQAAQDVAMVYADNRDIEPEMEKLLEAFQK